MLLLPCHAKFDEYQGYKIYFIHGHGRWIVSNLNNLSSTFIEFLKLMKNDI